MFASPITRARSIGLLFMLTALTGCATTGSKPVTDKRASVQEMRQNVLTEIYQEKPDVQSQVASAAGYAVFSNANINLILASFGGGYGVVHDNYTKQDIYMNMGEVGLGLGAGVKDFRVLMVFHSAEALNYFVNKGWAFGAQADATAKASDKGGAVGAEAIVNNITIYQLTQSGLSLQATIKGTKFWKNRELNQY